MSRFLAPSFRPTTRYRFPRKQLHHTFSSRRQQPRQTSLLHPNAPSLPRFQTPLHRYTSTTSKPKPKPIPKPIPSPSSPTLTPAPQSLSQRLRALSREYGYSALGVYVALLVLDFPFCWLAVQWLGVEMVKGWEAVVLRGVRKVLGALGLGEGWFGEGEVHGGEGSEGEDKDVDHEGSGGATIWTQLALAFLIHKSFIFMRVPLTAALTPKVVRTLRGWGWDIGKRKLRVEK
ncbi:hypothetical protein BCR34DRAFT_602136 [Clohesyomyces aquaticus]|uniref:DUF1279 domain-containing protein n=1 Tax=Clohesyomyces aquaticus TaxID=1231657 RepID=A0A1Y1ZJJ7_9PLEO|nr:hypothetical protein BCR34DRAFT_602136 [Clohesyomyces aquaticus]